MQEHENELLVITDPQQDRYASLRLIDWWNQERVQAARVMVVGAGALGNEVLKNLALLGVGHILVIDFDTIEASNLTRSVLFRREDWGRPKSQVAAERTQALNTDVQVIALNGDITQDLGTGVYRRMDVVISCLDNRAARLAVNQACWHVKVPWIDGALDTVNGLVRVFIPPNGACYECTMTAQDYALLDTRYSCQPGFTVIAGRQPTMPTTASIIAALQVQEAIKLLHGLKVSSGRVSYFGWQNIQFKDMLYTKRQDCPAHTTYETITSLPCGVDDLTLEQFIAVILPFLQDKGVIFLPHAVVAYFYCPTCERVEEVYRPYYEVIPTSVACPICATQRKYDVTSTLAVTEGQPKVPLAQLGIPALHIFPVRTRAGWHYFELSRDEQLVLQNWQIKDEVQ